MARQLAEALLLNGLAPVAGPWQAASVLLVELAALLHVADSAPYVLLAQSRADIVTAAGRVAVAASLR